MSKKQSFVVAIPKIPQYSAALRVDYCELFDSVYVRYDFFEFSSEEFWTCLLIHCIEAESDFSESLDIVQASFCCDKTKNWILFRANHQVGG